MSFENVMDWVLKKEGGYADHKLDGGKETMAGISRRFHPEWIGWVKLDAIKEKYGKVPQGDILMRELQGDIYDFYRESYYNPLKCKDLHPAVAFALMDFAIQFGVFKAVATLQTIVKCKVDGVMGPISVASANVMLPEKVVSQLFIKRTAAYIASDSPGRVEFANGWSNRLWQCWFECQDLLD